MRAVLVCLIALAAMPAWAAERLVLVERATGETPIDMAPQGDSLGDTVVLDNPMYDAANQTKLGANYGYCVRTVVGKQYECFWTMILKAGQITVSGPVLDAGESTLAVTGGTGKYVGAKGTVKIRARKTKGEYDFIYELQ